MKILLVCGGGASSGFLAQNMKTYAKKNNLNVQVDAVGEHEIEDYIEDRDIVLLGPHLKYLEDDIKDEIIEYGVPYYFIPDQFYSTLNGVKVVEFAIEKLEEKK